MIWETLQDSLQYKSNYLVIIGFTGSQIYRIETLNYHRKVLLYEDGFYGFCEQQSFLFHLSDLFLITLSADVSVTH